MTETTHWYSFCRNAGTTFLASLLSLGEEPPVGLESATWLSVAIPVRLLVKFEMAVRTEGGGDGGEQGDAGKVDELISYLSYRGDPR